jgi:hypothetical protein
LRIEERQGKGQLDDVREGERGGRTKNIATALTPKSSVCTVCRSKGGKTGIGVEEGDAIGVCSPLVE